MSGLISWFRPKKTHSFPVASRREVIKSFIVQKQVKEFSTCLRNTTDRPICLDMFILLLSSIPDEQYMSDLFELIKKTYRSSSKVFYTAITDKLSRTILDKDFDLCERILRLPLQSALVSFPTYELIRLIHTCSDREQVFRCLSSLIEKNLPYDHDYLSWVLLTLFEHYRPGDEEVIEYLFKLRKSANLLHGFFQNAGVTALMLFFHLYSNEKCQQLIDVYLSTLSDQSVLMQCDRWNRSYLTHLLCGKCEHTIDENPSKVIFEDVSQLNAELIRRCPHASSLLARFSMLHRLGNKLDQPVKTIFKSQFCLPLRMLLFNYLLENDHSFSEPFNDFFQFFPGKFLSTYSDYLKEIVRNHNLDGALESLVLYSTGVETDDSETIRFLLQRGARFDTTKSRHQIISRVYHTQSMIPFLLLDYSTYIDLSIELRTNVHLSRVLLYVALVARCGYATEFQKKFDEYKAVLPEQTVQTLLGLIDVKSPPCLSRLCVQKLRSSVKHLGDDTLEQLDGHLPKVLKQSLFHCAPASTRDFHNC